MFNTSLENFKHMTATLAKTMDAPQCLIEEVDAGFKCVTLHYLNSDFHNNDSEEIIALSYYKWITNKYNNFCIEYEINNV